MLITPVLRSQIVVEPPKHIDRFEMAVELIKEMEGWHGAGNHPYIGYGHRILPGEKLNYRISKQKATEILRSDLRKKCAVFRQYGKDSLLLGVLAYNVGEYNILGNKKIKRSRLIQKLESGDRDIYNEYISFRRYKGKVLPSLERRRKAEFKLLFINK
ncbi:MAG: glycoside hydrolase family protein [Bacteroidales bacterium]